MERWKERVYATYTRTAPTSNPACGTPAHERQQYLRRYGSFLPRDLAAPILDIGCGTGGFLDALRSVGYSSVEGVDLSASQVQTYFASLHG